MLKNCASVILASLLIGESLALDSAELLPGLPTHNHEKNHSNWAVLIAGSSGYYNYRHQSDISHAYWILRNLGGYPDSNIIVFMYDDIANNEQNPFPGALFNEPNGINYYANITIDYVGDEVNANNFLSVLKGIPPKTVPLGKVLESTKDDNVFIYYSDHGASGLVAMPVGAPLYADDLMSTLQFMYDNQMYNDLVFYLEACESGSMFDGLLPNNTNVYATTAANPCESSYAFYYNETLNTYMADEYSIRWMQDSTTSKKDGSKAITSETLETQFQDVLAIVAQSTPQQYGDFAVDTDSIDEFQGFDEDDSRKTQRNVNTYFENAFELAESDFEIHLTLANTILSESEFVDSRDVKLMTLYRRLAKNADNKVLSEIRKELKHRHAIDTFFYAFSVALGVNKPELFMGECFAPRNFECLKTGYAMFEANCQKWSDYSLKYVRTLVSSCERFGYDMTISTLANLCHGFHD